MEKTDTQTGEILFGGAQDLPPEEQPQPESIQLQCHKLLAAVHVHISITTAELLSEQECVVAAHWAMEYNKNPATAPARPFWLPIPEPPAAEVAPAEQLPGDRVEQELHRDRDHFRPQGRRRP